MTETSPSTNSMVDKCFTNSKNWRTEMETLRAILLGCDLTEELKWYQPCYTNEGKNIVIIHDFKQYCGLGFFKGALLKDPHGILIKPGENSREGKVARFTDVDGITKAEPILREYIAEAIDIQKSGLTIAPRKTEDYPVPDEFLQLSDSNPTLKDAFERLTPGRQRGYLLYFAGAKQSATRMARIEKYIPKILDGKGIND